MTEEKNVSHTTLRLPEKLFNELKKEAQNLGISFNAYIICVLTNEIIRQNDQV